MKTMTELEKIRAGADEKNVDGKTTISVGMATCGIAAGSRTVMNAFANEVRTRGIRNVEIKMMGCIGMCKLEPIVEVVEPDGTKTTYIEMTEGKAIRVINEHILGKKVVSEYTV